MAVYGGPDIVTDGLVLHLDAANTKSYPGSGNVWYDLSGNNNSSILNNGVNYSQEQYFVFDGSNDYIYTPVNIDANPCSVGAWFNASIITGARGIALTDNGGWDKGFEINNGFFSIHVGNSLASTGVPAQINTWYYGFLVYTSTSMAFYINGKNIWNGGIPGNTNGSTIEIGRANYFNGNGSRFFSGKIAQLSAYNTNISHSGILQNYNALKGRFGL